MIATAQQAILLLQSIEQRSKAHAFELPQQLEMKNTWDGVGFKLGDMQLVAAVDEVREILPLPHVTAVPGAKRWVKGVANVRGTLLPIMDLLGFVRGQNTVPGRRSRILVVRHRGISAGLLVDEILGLKHFLEEEYAVDSDVAESGVAPYLRGRYMQEGEGWTVFSMSSLVESPEFMQVAA